MYKALHYIKKLLAFSILLLFNSCSLIHFLTVDENRPPESPSTYNAYLKTLKIDTSYSFQLAAPYFDSINTEKYALNLYKLKYHSKASPVQIRFYSPTGDLLNGYEQCFGDLSRFDLLKSVPMQKVSWLPVNYNLKFSTDINLLNISENQKKSLLNEMKTYDYVLMVFYTKWAGWYSKNTLSKVNRYIKQNAKYKFLFIKVNASPVH